MPDIFFCDQVSISPFAVRLPHENDEWAQGNQGGNAMKFMMFMIPRVYQPNTPAGERAEDGYTPPADMVEKMMAYNEELAKAGALIALDGLHPPAKAARIAFSGGKTVVTDGPFAEVKEVIGGYWVIDVPSMKEAVTWARRCPAGDGDAIEIRQIFAETDFPEDIQKAADNPIVHEQVRKHEQG